MNTKQAAQNIANQLMKSIAGYTDSKPIIRKSEDDSSYKVILEGGPLDWPMNDNYGLFEELKAQGMPGEYQYKPYWEDPKGFYSEAINGYSIAVYRD